MYNMVRKIKNRINKVKNCIMMTKVCKELNSDN